MSTVPAGAAAQDDSGAPVKEPQRLTARAGGSVEVEVPSAPGSTVTVTLRRTDGAAFAGEAWVAVESAAGSADMVDVPVEGLRTLSASARLNGRDEVSRVRVGFARRGDYTVETRVRRGPRPVATREYTVEVSSSFEHVTSIPVNTEIVHATSDGMRMVSTATGGIAVFDISDVRSVPPPLVVPTSAVVTSVALTPDDRYVLVADFSGAVSVVDLTLPAPAKVAELAVPGGADAVAVSPDGRYAAVAIESGRVVIVDLVGDPADWTLRTVEVPLDDPVFSGEGAIENVDISPANKIAAASQTSGAVAVVDAPSGQVDTVFSLGESERLYDVDGYEHGVAFDTVATLPRLPDAVVWTPDGYLVTANENGGARSFGVFTATGEEVFDSGAELEQHAAFAGTWAPGDPEFEGADVATFGSGDTAETFAFVGAERWSSIAVYRVDPATDPRFVQMATVNSTRRDSRPEGIDAIPSRGLVLVANEDENTVSVLQRYESLPEDPTPAVGSAAVAWQELYGLDAVDEDSLVAVGQVNSTRVATLYRLSRTATELRVDSQVDLSSLVVTGVTTPTVNGVAHDPRRRGAWLAVNHTSGGLSPVIVRVDADGRIREPLLLGFGGANPAILGIDTDKRGEVIYALVRWRSAATGTFVHEIVEHRVSNGSQRRWLYQPSDGGAVVELTVLRDGSLGVVEDERLLRVSLDAPAGSTLPAALVRDLSVEDGFVGVESKHAEGVAITPSGTLVAVSANERFGRAPTLVVPGADVPPGARVDVDLDTPTSDEAAESVAGGDVAVSFTVDDAATWVVETRPSTRRDRDRDEDRDRADRDDDVWALARGDAVGVATAAGPVTTTITTPIVDGTYDLRVRTITKSGAVDADDERGALTVTTPAGTATILQPTAAAPVTAPRTAAVRVRFDADQAGTYQLVAAPASGGRRIALDVLGPAAGEVPGPGVVTADFVAPADGSYDLVLRYQPGGRRAVEVIQPDALVVTSPPKAQITLLPAGDAPVTTHARGRLNIAVTTDQPGTLNVEWRRAGAGQQPWTLVGGFAGRAVGAATTVTGTTFGPLDDGTYDLRVRFTNAAGVVTTALNKGAVVVETPTPTVTITTPTTDAPFTSFAGDRVFLEATVDQTGEFRVESRPTGSGDDAWRGAFGLAFADTSQPTIARLLVLPAPDGSYDLRVVFRNHQGTEAVDVEAGAMVVNTPQAHVELLKPTTQAPDTVTAGQVNYVTRMRADQNLTLTFDVRRSGTDTWIPVPVQGPRSVPANQDANIVHTLPVVVDGSYDVRMRFTNGVGIVTEIIEPGALIFATPPVTATMNTLTTARPLKRNPNVDVTVGITLSTPANWELFIRPSGAGEDAFERVADGRPITNNPTSAVISTPHTAGAYDLRVTARDVNGNTHVHDEPSALIVGAGPAAPVVITEAAEQGPLGFSDQFVELRNVSAEPVDISGWQIAYCRTTMTLGVVPDGVVLAPGEHLLFAGPDYPGGTAPDLPTEDVPMTRLFGSFDGIELLRPNGSTVDSVSSYESRPCYEGAPAPTRQLDTESISRDSNGTDTDDNSADFTVGPRTPTARNQRTDSRRARA